MLQQPCLSPSQNKKHRSKQHRKQHSERDNRKQAILGLTNVRGKCTSYEAIPTAFLQLCKIALTHAAAILSLLRPCPRTQSATQTFLGRSCSSGHPVPSYILPSPGLLTPAQASAGPPVGAGHSTAIWRNEREGRMTVSIAPCPAPTKGTRAERQLQAAEGLAILVPRPNGVQSVGSEPG